MMIAEPKKETQVEEAEVKGPQLSELKQMSEPAGPESQEEEKKEDEQVQGQASWKLGRGFEMYTKSLALAEAEKASVSECEAPTAVVAVPPTVEELAVVEEPAVAEASPESVEKREASEGEQVPAPIEDAERTVDVQVQPSEVEKPEEHVESDVIKEIAHVKVPEQTIANVTVVETEHETPVAKEEPTEGDDVVEPVVLEGPRALKKKSKGGEKAEEKKEDQSASSQSVQSSIGACFCW